MSAGGSDAVNEALRDRDKRIAELEAQVASQSWKRRWKSQRWIPVDERLPDHDVVILAYHPDWGAGLIRWNKYGANEVGLVPMAATHWLKLPDPPLEETT